MKRFVIVTAVALSLSACQSGGFGGMGTKQSVGTLGGAAAGGLLGSQIGGGTGKLIATGAGVLLGAFLGGQLGQSLDRADEAYARQAAQQAFAAPTGRATNWYNPESGHSGTVTPLGSGFTNASGERCREYQQTVVIGGRSQLANGTACRQADGQWRIVGL